MMTLEQWIRKLARDSMKPKTPHVVRGIRVTHREVHPPKQRAV